MNSSQSEIEYLVEDFNKILKDNDCPLEDSDRLLIAYSLHQSIVFENISVRQMLVSYPTMLQTVLYLKTKYTTRYDVLSDKINYARSSVMIDARVSRGYDGFAARERADVDIGVRKLVDLQLRLTPVVRHLENLVKVVQTRLTILEHLSHNSRVEDRLDIQLVKNGID